MSQSEDDVERNGPHHQGDPLERPSRPPSDERPDTADSRILSDLLRVAEEDPRATYGPVIDMLHALAADVSSGIDASPAIRFLPILIYLEIATSESVKSVRGAVRSFLDFEGFEVIYEEAGVWGSWFGRSIARSKHALKSDQARDIQMRTGRALEMQALLLPQAQVDAAQADGAARLLSSLSGTPNALVRIGSILIIKVDGVPIVRNLTQTELSYLEHNRHLYRSPKDALEGLSKVRDDSNESTLLSGNSGGQRGTVSLE